MTHSTYSTAVRWILLFVLSYSFFWIFHYYQLPAALLLGPMIAAIVLSSLAMTVSISKPLFSLSMAFVGVMIAGLMPVTIVSQVSEHWLIFLSGALFTIVVAALLGWLLSRSEMFPGNTAIWGTSPGAAMVMTLMSESFGGDIRLVALMQYLRVACCTLSVTLVGHYLGAAAAHSTAPQLNLFKITSTPDFLKTTGIVLLCFAIVQILKKPSISFILPMVVGIVMKMLGLTDIVIPGVILAIAYTTIGWNIGLRFTRSILHHAAKLLPLLLLSIAMLLAVNAAFGLVIAKWAGIDYLTAFLATSPGGADSVSIIAASTPVDVGFVVTMQVIRFFMVILLSPMLARWLSRSRQLKKKSNNR